MSRHGTVFTTIFSCLLTVGGILVSREGTTVHRIACLFFVLADVVAMMGGGIWVYQKSERWDFLDYVKALGLVAFCVFVMPIVIYFFWSPAEAQTPSPPPSVNGNCNAIGNNNANCSNITIAPQRMTLTDDIKSQLLQKIPKEKPGFVDIVGPSQADLRVGLEILGFLKNNGFNVQEGNASAYVAPAPERPLELQDSPKSPSWRLVVAPSAR